MKVAVVLLVNNESMVDVARQPIAGRAWIVHMVERLRTARCVSRVMVVCRERRDEIAALFTGGTAVVAAADPLQIAALGADEDGMVFCPVEQFFVDPVRLDRLASADIRSDVGCVTPVLESDPFVPLAGGAFVTIVTRAGLAAMRAGRPLGELPSAALPCAPEPPEMRLVEREHFQWAVAAAEALLAKDPSGALALFEEVIAAAELPAFRCWDTGGRPPARTLTVRCLPLPLFAHCLRFLRRNGVGAIDVICPAALADETGAVPGVEGVIRFDGPTFSLDALGPVRLEAIRRTAYDLCVVPRREPTGRAFENVTPLASASNARTAIWLDPLGQFSALSTPPDPAVLSIAAPHTQGPEYLRRASLALEAFTVRRRHAAPESEFARLLQKTDENVTCQPLLENPENGIDVSAPLLYQLPSAIEILTRLDDLERSAHPGAAALAAAVDEIFEKLVTAIAIQPPGNGLLEVSRDARTIVDLLASRIAANPASLGARSFSPAWSVTA